MADIELVVGEFGDSYDITIIDNETGAAADLDDFDTLTLTITSTDFATEILSVSLSKPAGTTGVVRWAILSTHTASLTAGTYTAQIDMVDTGVSVRRKTLHMSVKVLGKLD